MTDHATTPTGPARRADRQRDQHRDPGIGRSDPCGYSEHCGRQPGSGRPRPGPDPAAARRFAGNARRPRAAGRPDRAGRSTTSRLYDQAATGGHSRRGGASRGLARSTPRTRRPRTEARAELVATAVHNYVNGIDTAPQLGVIATSTDPSSLLERLAVVEQIGAQQATSRRSCGRGRRRCRRGEGRPGRRRGQGAARSTQAQDALGCGPGIAGRRLRTSLSSAHLSDVRAQAAAAAADAHTVGRRGGRPQGAEPGNRGGDRGGLPGRGQPRRGDRGGRRRAATPGRRTHARPEADPRRPGFQRPHVRSRRRAGRDGTDARPRPHGPLRRAARGRAGPLARGFRNDPVQANWPNAGVGLGVPGTAKPLPANGVTVNPVIRSRRWPGVARGGRGGRRARPARPPVRLGRRRARPRFDCSGLTLWAWGHAGIGLPHFAADQAWPERPRRTEPTAARRPDPVRRQTCTTSGSTSAPGS